MEYIDGRSVVTVGIDETASGDAAVSWSLEYARSHRLPLRLVAAIPAGGRADGGRPAELTRARVDDLALLCRSTAPGTEVTGVVAAEPLGAALLDAAHDSVLVVIGDRSGPRHISDRRPAVDAVVAWAECPVVVARSARWPNPATPIVAALDGSDHDDPVLDAAFDLAARSASPLVAVHLQPDAQARGAAPRVAARLAHRERGYVRVPVRFRAAVGPAVPVLLAASQWAGLLVVGAPGTDGVTRELTRAAACPVLVARPLGVSADPRWLAAATP